MLITGDSVVAGFELGNGRKTTIDQLKQLSDNGQEVELVNALVEYERNWTNPVVSSREVSLLQHILWNLPANEGQHPELDYGVYGRLTNKLNNIRFNLEVTGRRMLTCADIPAYVWDRVFPTNFNVELFARVDADYIKNQAYREIKLISSEFDWNIYSAINQQTGQLCLLINARPNRSGYGTDFVRILTPCHWNEIFKMTDCFFPIHRFGEVKYKSGVILDEEREDDSMWELYLETNYLQKSTNEEWKVANRVSIVFELLIAILALKTTGYLFSYLDRYHLFYYSNPQPRIYTLNGQTYLINNVVHPLVVQTDNIVEADNPNYTQKSKIEIFDYLLGKEYYELDKIVSKSVLDVLNTGMFNQLITHTIPAGAKVYQALTL